MHTRMLSITLDSPRMCVPTALAVWVPRPPVRQVPFGLPPRPPACEGEESPIKDCVGTRQGESEDGGGPRQ